MLDVSQREAIHESLGPHKFQESEFAEGAGRCDRCGGGEFAAIHQPVVDHSKRAADSLEYIAGRLGNIDVWTSKQIEPLEHIAQAVERIADEMEYKRRCGAFWRLYEWLRGFFYRYPGPLDLTDTIVSMGPGGTVPTAMQAMAVMHPREACRCAACVEARKAGDPGGLAV